MLGGWGGWGEIKGRNGDICNTIKNLKEKKEISRKHMGLNEADLHCGKGGKMVKQVRTR